MSMYVTHDSFMTRRVTIGIHKYMFRNCSGKRKALRFDLKESREDFRWRGSRRSFHVEGLKTEMVWEPTVESLVQGICAYVTQMWCGMGWRGLEGGGREECTLCAHLCLHACHCVMWGCACAGGWRKVEQPCFCMHAHVPAREPSPRGWASPDAPLTVPWWAWGAGGWAVCWVSSAACACPAPPSVSASSSPASSSPGLSWDGQTVTGGLEVPPPSFASACELWGKHQFV